MSELMSRQMDEQTAKEVLSMHVLNRSTKQILTDYLHFILSIKW